MFNHHFPTKVPVDVNKVRTLYRRLKTEAKKEVFAHKRAQKKTGGGPPPPEPSSQSKVLMELCPNMSFELQNPFDDDAIPSTADKTAIFEAPEDIAEDASPLDQSQSSSAVFQVDDSGTTEESEFPHFYSHLFE